MLDSPLLILWSYYNTTYIYIVPFTLGAYLKCFKVLDELGLGAKVVVWRKMTKNVVKEVRFEICLSVLYTLISTDRILYCILCRT